MTTGALLLDSDRKINMRAVLKKYIPRIILPFIAVVYLIEITSEVIAGTLSFRVIFLPMLYVMFDKVSIPYWYIYMLIGIYLLLPFIKKIVNQSSKREIEFLLVVFLGLRVVVPFLDYFLGTSIFSETIGSLQITLFNGYIGYLILGYYIDRYISIKKKSTLCMLILLNIFTVLAPMILIPNLSNYKDVGIFLADVHSPCVFAISVTLMIIMKSFSFDRGTNIKKLVMNISGATFGIYLLHVYLLQIFEVVGFVKSTEEMIWQIPVFAFINFICAYLLVEVIHSAKKHIKSVCGRK